MIKLYKALIETGATVEISPSKDLLGSVMVTIRYKGEKHRKPYDIVFHGNELENLLVWELYSFVNRIDIIRGDNVVVVC